MASSFPDLKPSACIFAGQPIVMMTSNRTNLCGSPIFFVEQIQFFGLIFDQCLTFKPHIQHLKAKCLQTLDLLQVLSDTFASVIFTSLVTSSLGLQEEEPQTAHTMSLTWEVAKWHRACLNVISLVTTCVGLQQEESQTAYPLPLQPLACSQDIKLYPIESLIWASHRHS